MGKAIDELKRDILAELTNAYFESYRYDRPNDSVEQLSAFARDLATNELDELLNEVRKDEIGLIIRDTLEPENVNGRFIHAEVKEFAKQQKQWLNERMSKLTESIDSEATTNGSAKTKPSERKP